MKTRSGCRAIARRSRGARRPATSSCCSAAAATCRYARALEIEGIANEIAGGGAFGESEQLAALVPLLEALADPDDPVPFVAALRGPIFGVDDDALVSIRAGRRSVPIRAEPPAAADPADRPRRADLPRGPFRRRSASSGRRDREALDRLGLVALASAEELGASRAGNLLKALAAARKFSADGLDFAGVVAELDRMRHED